MDPLFLDIGVAVVSAAVLAGLARLLKQPPLLAYVVAGVILGPLGAHFLHSQQAFASLKEVGVALSLFLIGLELDWSRARTVIRNTFMLGSVQVLGSLALGFIAGQLLGLSVAASLYAGLALCFSSTVVVVKLLSEGRELAALHGRLAVGLLIFQDLAAVAALVALGGFSTPSHFSVPFLIVLLIVKLVASMTALYLASKYILPPLFARIAHSSELLFLAGLAWCFLLALLLGWLDFPLAIGAFLAGVSLAALPYALDILSRLRSLRDFFVILLFVSLGSTLVLPGVSQIPLTVTLVLLTVLAKPLLVFLALSAQGYRSRTAFLTALTQGPMSEFALIILPLGLASGQLTPVVSSAILFACIISIIIGTAILGSRDRIYNRLRNVLRRFEKLHRHHPHAEPPTEPLKDHVVLFGYHRMGYHILRKLHGLGHHALVVDFNPDIIRHLKSENVDCLYGDIQDEDILEAVQAKTAAMVISTIPHREETIFLLAELARLKAKGTVVVTSNHIDDALEYYRQGAEYVILPHMLSGEHVAELIGRYRAGTLADFLRDQKEELGLLRARNHRLYYD